MNEKNKFCEIEWAIYNKWFDYLTSLFNYDLNGVIYL